LSLASIPRSCNQLLLSSEAKRVTKDPFENIDKLEVRLSKLMNEISAQFSSDITMNARLESILNFANNEMQAIMRFQ
jgi:hypothetical protein